MSELLNSSSGESSTETSTDSSESKPSKKKPTAVTTTLGGLTAERALTAEAPKKEEPKRETIWEQIGRIADEPQKTETSAQDAPLEKAARNTEQPAEKQGEQASVETLSPEEMQETVRQYADARFDVVQSEMHDLPPESSAAAEAAADAAFLSQVQQRMAEYPQQPVGEALDNAEADVIHRIDEAVPENVHDADNQYFETEAASHSSEDVSSSVGAEQHAPLFAEGSGGGIVPPEVAASLYGGGDEPPGPPQGPRGGGYSSGGEIMPTVPLPMPRAESVAVPTIPATEALANERSAAAGGLLVGGVVGYLMGRRKGRIKTERKMAPVQQKLEREVKALHETIAVKEQYIRVQAAEKMQGVRERQERQRITEQLKAAAVIPAQRTETAPRQNEAYAAAATAERSPAPTERIVQQPERFGRLVVESPLAAAALAGKSAEQLTRTPALLKQHKRIEQFTPSEIDKAAQKVKFEGVTLKELQDTKRLDERGVRRVLAEHLRGGNVNEVLAKELLEKELSFERDPRMRAQIASHLAGGGSHVAAAAAVIASWNDPKQDQAAAFDAVAKERSQAEAFDKAAQKRRQTTTVAGGTVVLAAIALILVLLLA